MNVQAKTKTRYWIINLMNKRFNSVPRLKIATSLSIDNNNLQSPI